MIKKIQNLLFEDETTEDFEEPAVPEVVAPVVEEKPVVKVEPEAVVAPVVKEEVAAPVVEEPVVQKPSFPNITIDDKQEQKPTYIKRPKKEARRPVESKPVSYQFQPVISPIFGADEKDINALKSTTSKLNEQEKKKHMEGVTTILSPMWGTEDNSPLKEVEKKVEEPTDLLASMDTSMDDEIPEFSLDDILSVRDQEYGNTSEAEDDLFETESGVFPQLNLFDDELEDAKDNTTVFQKPLSE